MQQYERQNSKLLEMSSIRRVCGLEMSQDSGWFSAITVVILDFLIFSLRRFLERRC